ncbi:unnamed protein product [Bemisia tabaci]|uniref:D-beta-hydroxybutyrate dehydrogenase, mitochondrial n=1 Tax=Bemisia tabaci TaxID=7038 RepID=A0A9P0CCF9_BEMTA|nr:unnamed protein product [Bemisia tabaci]
MDDETAMILAVQLVALSCIVGALLLYLLCKTAKRKHTYDAAFASLNVGTGRSVLITSAETAFGLQLALHLTSLGFRVFAGYKPKVREDDIQCRACNKEDQQEDEFVYPVPEAVRILTAKVKHRESQTTSLSVGSYEDRSSFGSLISLPVDVTREDSLHEAVDIVRRHLPAGEDGLWAVINTAGMCLKGRLDQQESSLWDAMFKINVVGTLRTARAFLPLLQIKQGRLINIGASGEREQGCGLVAYTAARHAVVGASAALRQEIGPLGVRVITIHTDAIPSEKLFTWPRLMKCGEEDADLTERYIKYNPSVIPSYGMETIEEAILTETPKAAYSLSKPTGFSNYVSAISQKFHHSK